MKTSGVLIYTNRTFKENILEDFDTMASENHAGTF
jgi:hypothetical protein